MVRSQYVAKSELLHPVLTRLDMHMREELHTSASTDTMNAHVVCTVDISMDDKYWYDWNKVLSVLPRAAAWQEALTPEEPFNQITAGYFIAGLLMEGEPLQAVLELLAKQYNLDVAHDVRSLETFRNRQSSLRICLVRLVSIAEEALTYAAAGGSEYQDDEKPASGQERPACRSTAIET